MNKHLNTASLNGILEAFSNIMEEHQHENVTLDVDKLSTVQFFSITTIRYHPKRVVW